MEFNQATYTLGAICFIATLFWAASTHDLSKGRRLLTNNEATHVLVTACRCAAIAGLSGIIFLLVALHSVMLTVLTAWLALNLVSTACLVSLIVRDNHYDYNIEP